MTKAKLRKGDRNKVYAFLMRERSITSEEAVIMFNAMLRTERQRIVREALNAKYTND